MRKQATFSWKILRTSCLQTILELVCVSCKPDLMGAIKKRHIPATRWGWGRLNLFQAWLPKLNWQGTRKHVIFLLLREAHVQNSGMSRSYPRSKMEFP